MGWGWRASRCLDALPSKVNLAVLHFHKTLTKNTAARRGRRYFFLVLIEENKGSKNLAEIVWLSK